MADLIFVNHDEISRKADELEKKANEYKKLIDNITKLTLSLCYVWNGESHQKFVAYYDAEMPNLEKGAELGEEAAKLIREYLTTMKNADVASATKIRNLF